MAFAWDIFAEEIGKVGEGLASGIRQRGINKAAEERALRMHEERLKIEQPFKDLDSTRILERQKAIQAEGVELQKGLEEWKGELSRGLDIFAGSEGYQKAIEKARKEGGLSQVAVMRMEDSIMRARAGEMVNMSDFEGLDPFDRMKVMDLLKQNQMIITNAAQKQQMLDREDMELQNEIDTRGRGLVDVKRGLDIERTLNTEIEKDEKEFSDYFGELMNELSGAKEGTPKIIDSQGRYKVKQLGKDLKAPLYNMETGEVNQWVLEELYKKYPQYRQKFKRLRTLQANVMRSQAMRDEYIPGEPMGEPAGTSNTWTSPEGKAWEIGEVGVATKGKYKGKKIRHLGDGKFELVE